MKRSPLLSLPVAVVAISLQASAQPAPLPTLPPPATASAPSTLNPNAAPPPGAPPSAAPPAPIAPASAPPAAQPQPPPSAPPPPPFDGTAAPTDFTRVAAPQVAPPPEPPPPIAVTGPGTFTHDGFYFRLATGVGALALIGSGPYGAAHAHGVSGTTTLAIGGTPSRGFVVGGAFAGQAVSSPGWSGIQGNLSGASSGGVYGFADWFPNERGGWHVGGLLGLAFVTVSAHDQSDRSGASFGGEAFGGYDMWIGPQWSLGLQGAFTFATKAALKDDNQNDTGYSLGSVGAALEVTLLYH